MSVYFIPIVPSFTGTTGNKEFLERKNFFLNFAGINLENMVCILLPNTYIISLQIFIAPICFISLPLVVL